MSPPYNRWDTARSRAFSELNDEFMEIWPFKFIHSCTCYPFSTECSAVPRLFLNSGACSTTFNEWAVFSQEWNLLSSRFYDVYYQVTGVNLSKAINGINMIASIWICLYNEYLELFQNQIKLDNSGLLSEFILFNTPLFNIFCNQEIKVLLCALCSLLVVCCVDTNYFSLLITVNHQRLASDWLIDDINLTKPRWLLL